MRRAFSLLEVIFTLVIISILSIGAFKAIEMLYLHSTELRIRSKLSIRSQIVLDQLSSLLYQRIPNTLIGYQPDCQALQDANDKYQILEWLIFDESNLSRKNYIPFVDMANSDSKNHILDTNISMEDLSLYNLIFAGSFDQGSQEIPACKGAYGWHGNDSNLSFDIAHTDSDDINITDRVQPKYIYEKYYLSHTALGVALSKDINLSAKCIDNNLSDWDKNSNTLLLFYDYRPYKKETFCADKNDSLDHNGSVTILAQHVSAFKAKYINGIIRISIEMNQSIRGSKASIHLSKQKGIF